MIKIPLTVKGAESLRNELHQLKTVDRPSVIAAIAEARSHGDLSENAEYDAAKERQGFVEGRIKEIEGKLSNAQIIDPTLLDADGRCVFGATLDLEDQDSGTKVCYQIVGEDEDDIRLCIFFRRTGIRHESRGDQSGAQQHLVCTFHLFSVLDIENFPQHTIRPDLIYDYRDFF